MHFPSWCDRERTSHARASKRLKFILQQGALRKFGRTSMHDLATAIGVHHSSIFNAISRGSMSADMAKAVEKELGREFAAVEWLVAPLDVPAA